MIGIWEMIVLYIWGAGENFLGLQNINKHICIIQIRIYGGGHPNPALIRPENSPIITLSN